MSDPTAIVEAVNKHAKCGLVPTAVARHGETSGAVFVKWPDGRDGVLTVATVSAGRMHQTAELLAMLRDNGVPAPKHDLIVELPDGMVAVVQERLPGSPPSRTDAEVIDKMVELNERLAGLLSDRPDIPVQPLALPECEKTLAGHDDRSRHMLDRIRATITHEMTGNDLLHPDFTVPNVLFDGTASITGLVDWNNGIARGDRGFALVSLRYDLAWDAWSADGGQLDVQPGAIERLDEHLATMLEPELMRLYWAHLTLRKLHFAIKFNNTESIDMQLRLGESILG
jgi:aminoglycoside phosphotransferase (APT) family kinase protein